MPIYTSNTMERYHRKVRKVTKSKGALVSNMAVMKMVFQAIMNFQNKGDAPIFGWYGI